MDSDIQQPTKPNPLASQGETLQAPNPKRNIFLKALSILVFLVLCIVFSYIFLARPYRIVGNPIFPFHKDEYTLSEKITYLFQKPQVGDRVNFVSEKGAIDWVGIVIDIQDKNNITTYTIQSGSTGNPWIVSQDKITGRIYYPFVNEEDISKTISLLHPKPSPTEEKNLQSILSTYCKKVSFPGGFYTTINVSDLPITFAPQILNTIDQSKIACANESPHSYVQIPITDTSFTIYDDSSKELGHGGAPWFGKYGTVISSTENTILLESLNGGETGSIVGESAVLIREIKTFYLKNGSIIYVSADTKAIPSDDSRLVNLLNTYSELSQIEAGKKDVNKNIDQVNSAIVKTFFSDMNNLSSPEKQNIQNLETLFNSITINDQNMGAEGKFCGGIAGNLKENQCPSGYNCKLDGNYPDAGGKCVKD